MTKRLLGLMALVVILAACNGGGGGAPADSSGVNPIEWDRNPNTIVFRADVVGGNNQTFIARNEVPVCTVYGDNRVVWTNEVGPFNLQVLWDKVSDEQIRNFVTYLTINEQFYIYQAKANLEPPSNVTPVVETLTLFVNGVTHQSDAFSGWNVDYFQRVVDNCKGISRAPVLFEPTTAWVSAQVVPYDSSAPGTLWNAQASGLSLAELAASGKPRWITDRNVAVLWNMIRTSPPDIQFVEDNVLYQIALEVPNVTRASPAAPSS